MKICYVERRFKPSTMKIIEQANEIIDAYLADGFKLTLRQLYYQFVSRDIIPNTQKEYKNLGSIINDARLAGLIDWNSIEDRTRNLQSLSTWDSPSEIVQTCADQYRRDNWETQANRVEVWIEKDALTGVIERVCNKLEVPYFSCRGYTSQSELWGAAMRLQRYKNGGQNPVVIHLGDHDPSGIDMSRDILDRFNIFAEASGIEVRRIALNFDQVKKYNPPPNPAKQTDSRFESYIGKFGRKCWELDALEPKVIEALVRKEVLSLRTTDEWSESERRQEDERGQIQEAADGMK